MNITFIAPPAAGKGALSNKIYEKYKFPHISIGDLLRNTDDNEIKAVINKIINDNPDSVNDYLNGHDRAIKYLMGQVMKETKGKANPAMASELLKEELARFAS